MTPEEEAKELIRTFKEEEMFEYDVVERHAVQRALKCCSLWIRMFASLNSSEEKINHYRQIENILKEKLR